MGRSAYPGKEADTMHNPDGTNDQCVIAELIGAISTYLATHQETISGVGDVLAQISSATVRGNFHETNSAAPSAHTDILKKAVENIEDEHLEAIRRCLMSSMDELIWRQDEDEFYPADSDPGDSYRASNLHTLLIGPSNAKYYRPDFTLGIFLLGPFTLYRDHFHLAPELYVNLSPRSGWRFQGGEWSDYGAGSLIWNDSNEVHATRVYDDPFISIFAWASDIKSPCKIFNCDDWERVEKELVVK
jgi:hypothetical protein